jgi:hypothetical protein
MKQPVIAYRSGCEIQIDIHTLDFPDKEYERFISTLKDEGFIDTTKSDYGITSDKTSLQFRLPSDCCYAGIESEVSQIFSDTLRLRLSFDSLPPTRVWATRLLCFGRRLISGYRTNVE